MPLVKKVDKPRRRPRLRPIFRIRVDKRPKKPPIVNCVTNVYDLLPSLLETYEAILHRVAKLDDVTWEKFTEVWKELKCITIYHDVCSVLRHYTVIEFTEEALTMAKDLWLKQSELKKQIAAFFLLWAMYLQQPFKNPEFFVKITLKVGEGEKFHMFCKELERTNCDNALQVAEYMWDLSAFSLRATRYVHGLEPIYQLNLWRDHDKALIPPLEGCSFEEVDILKVYGDLVTKYTQLKRAMNPEGLSHRNLDLLDESTIQLLQSCLVPIEPSRSPGESGTPTEEPESIEARRRSIKTAAFQRGCVSATSSPVQPEK